MKTAWLSGAVFAAAMLGIGAANAAVVVVGVGFARGCYSAALQERSTSQAIDVCTQALNEQPLNRRNRAATLVNRGIIHLNRHENGLALADFDEALQLMPELAEAHTNRGAALLEQGDFRAAIASADQGISLETSEPHKAYFIRAAANEELGDMSAAYRDYLRASELAPDWNPARTELARFRVTR